MAVGAMRSHNGAPPPGKNALSRMLEMEKLGQAQRAYSTPTTATLPLKPALSPNQVSPIQTMQYPSRKTATVQLHVATGRLVRSVTAPQLELMTQNLPTGPVKTYDDSGTASENEPPSPSICHSPTWSDHGAKARKREEREMAKGRKGQAKKLKKAEEQKKHKKTLSETSIPRSSKRPPAAMDTQRMPAALKLSPEPVSQISKAEPSENSRTSWTDRRRSSVTSLASAIRLSVPFTSKTTPMSQPAMIQQDNFTRAVPTAQSFPPATKSKGDRPKSISSFSALFDPLLASAKGSQDRSGDIASVAQGQNCPVHNSRMSQRMASHVQSRNQRTKSTNDVTSQAMASVSAEIEKCVDTTQRPSMSPRSDSSKSRFEGKRDNAEGGYRYPIIGRSPPGSPHSIQRSPYHSRTTSDASSSYTSQSFASDATKAGEQNHADGSGYVHKQRMRQRERSIESYEEQVHISRIIQDIREQELIEKASRPSFSSSSSEYYEADSTLSKEDADDADKTLVSERRFMKPDPESRLRSTANNSQSQGAIADRSTEQANTMNSDSAPVLEFELSEVDLRVSRLSQTLLPLPQYQQQSKQIPLRKRGRQAITGRNMYNATQKEFSASPATEASEKGGKSTADTMKSGIARMEELREGEMKRKSTQGSSLERPGDLAANNEPTSPSARTPATTTSGSPRRSNIKNAERATNHRAERTATDSGSSSPKVTFIDQQDSGPSDEKLVHQMFSHHARSDPGLVSGGPKPMATQKPSRHHQRRPFDRPANESTSGSDQDFPSDTCSAPLLGFEPPIFSTGNQAPRSASSLPLTLEPLPSPLSISSALPSPPPRNPMRRMKRSSVATTPILSMDRSQAIKESLNSKPVAKMFVICCNCKYWHDLPSKVYKAMVLPPNVAGRAGERRSSISVVAKGEIGQGEESSSDEEKPFQTVRCPWCHHGMSSACCAGWTTLVYLHERHH